MNMRQRMFQHGSDDRKSKKSVEVNTESISGRPRWSNMEVTQNDRRNGIRKGDSESRSKGRGHEKRAKSPEGLGRNNDGDDPEARQRSHKGERMETNTAGKYNREMIVAQDLGDQEHRGHPLSFAGRKGTAAIHSVMLMNQLRQESVGTVCGKDIKSAFNSIRGNGILSELPDMGKWVDRFLEPREFDIRMDG